MPISFDLQLPLVRNCDKQQGNVDQRQLLSETERLKRYDKRDSGTWALTFDITGASSFIAGVRVDGWVGRHAVQ